MKSYERLKDMLCEELEKIAKKGELSASSLDLAHKLTDTIKNIDKIQMYEEFDDDGGVSYRRGRSKSAPRDRMGRYTSEDDYSEDGYRIYGRGYSRDGSKDHLIEKIEEMMEDADPKSRDALKRAVKQIENA